MCLETGCEHGKLSEGADAKEQRHEAAENRGRRADDAVWSRDWRLQVRAVNEAAAGAAGRDLGGLWCLVTKCDFWC